MHCPVCEILCLVCATVHVTGFERYLALKISIGIFTVKADVMLQYVGFEHMEPLFKVVTNGLFNVN